MTSPLRIPVRVYYHKGMLSVRVCYLSGAGDDRGEWDHAQGGICEEG